MGRATGAGSRWTRTGGMQKEVREINRALQAMERRSGCLLWALGSDRRVSSRRVSDTIHLLHHSGLLCREWILGRQEWKQGGQREVLQGGLGLGWWHDSGEDWGVGGLHISIILLKRSWRSSNTCLWRLEEGWCPLPSLSAWQGAVPLCSPYIWVCISNWTRSLWRRTSLFPVQGHIG